jgi:hypothetical protein
MATLCSCPKSDCPPTETAPLVVPTSGEAPAPSPNLPSQLMRSRRCSTFHSPPSTSGTRKAQGLRVIKRTRRANTEEAMWSGGWRSKGSHWRFARANAVGPTREPRSRRCQARNPFGSRLREAGCCSRPEGRNRRSRTYMAVHVRTCRGSTSIMLPPRTHRDYPLRLDISP